MFYQVLDGWMGGWETQMSVVYARVDQLDKPLPVPRFAQQFFHFLLAVMVVKEHFVEKGVAYLHINE